MSRAGRELATVLRLAQGGGAVLANIGHSRDDECSTLAAAFTEAWQDLGGQVGEIVSWPATAASWLRPAGRFSAGAPDVWVVATQLDGWIGMGGRLAALTSWKAHSTVAFSGLMDRSLPLLVDRKAVDGLRGAAADGGVWTFHDGSLRVSGPDSGWDAPLAYAGSGDGSATGARHHDADPSLSQADGHRRSTGRWG